MKIAVDARQTKVRPIVLAPVLARADVFDVQRSQRGIFLMQSAIFATVGSTAAHEGSGRCRHETAPGRIARASRRRTATNLLACT